MIIYMALEVFRAVIPRASANEHTASKPFWPVVAVRSTTIRSVVIVTVRTFRGRPNVDIDLSFYFRSGYREADSSHSNDHEKFASVHRLSSILVTAFIDLFLGYSIGREKKQARDNPLSARQGDFPLPGGLASNIGSMYRSVPDKDANPGVELD
jgi:hypothetical protein